MAAQKMLVLPKLLLIGVKIKMLKTTHTSFYKPKGFTLIELLVAMVITGIMLTLVMGSYWTFLQTQQKMTVSREIQSEVRFALSRITDKVRSGRINYSQYSGSGDCTTNINHNLCLIDTSGNPYFLAYNATEKNISMGSDPSDAQLKTYLIQVTKIQPKAEGSALLISIFLSGLMLTVGIMSARLAVQEAQMSADLFLSEKAYLSAESGVERSLWLLKSEPLAHVAPTTDILLGDSQTTVSVNNLIDNTVDNFPKNQFSFTLPNLGSQKFRFRHDSDNTITTSETLIPGSVQIDLDTPGTLFWRFLCQDSAGQTQSLQGRLNSITSVGDITATNGKTDDGVDTTFNTWAGIEKSSCYISIQN